MSVANITTPKMSLAVQGGQLGFLGTHQFWTSVGEQEEFFTMMDREHNVLHKLCHIVIQHDTTVQHESEAIKSVSTFQLFNKIVSVLVSDRYKGLPAPRTILEEPDLPTRSFTLEQLEAEIHLGFRQSPNVQLTADTVTRIKQGAIKRQQFQIALCSHIACSLVAGCVFGDRREDFVASVDHGMFIREQGLAKKDIQWKDAGLWTAKYTDDRLTRYLAMYIQANAENSQPADRNSLSGLRTERRKAIELHATTVRGNTPKGIPINQALLTKTRDCLRRIIVDLNSLIETEDARASVELPRAAPDGGRASEDLVPVSQVQDATLETDDGIVVLDQPAIAKALTEVLDLAVQPAARVPQHTHHPAMRTVAVAAHIHREKKKAAVEQNPQYETPDEYELPRTELEQIGRYEQATEELPATEQNKDGETSEELVRTFPARYLIKYAGSHSLSDRQSREILHSTFSDRQRESIRQGNASGYVARRDPFVGVRNEDVRDEIREFAHGPTNTIDGVPANGSPRRDIPWSDAVDPSMFQPDERISTSPNPTGMELEVDEALLRNPEKESFQKVLTE